MTRQLTVEGREGPFQLSVGERVCVPHNLRQLRGSVDDIVRIADQFTSGQDGIHVCYGTPYGTMTVVVRGQHEIDGAQYGKVRAVWSGDSGSKQQMRSGLPVYDRPPLSMSLTQANRPYANE